MNASDSVQKVDVERPVATDWVASAVELWSPLLEGSRDWTAQCCTATTTAGAAWLDFIGKRAATDVELMQRLASSKSAYEAWSTYSGFLRKAIADYQKALTDLAKLSLIRPLSETDEEPALAPTVTLPVIRQVSLPMVFERHSEHQAAKA